MNERLMNNTEVNTSIGRREGQVLGVEYLVQELFPESKKTYEQWYYILHAKQLEKDRAIEFAEKCLAKAKDLDVRTAFMNVEEYYQRFLNTVVSLGGGRRARVALAVEYLAQELLPNSFTINQWCHISHAKELEKEKAIEFAKKCLDKAKDLDITTASMNVEEYYETFKSE